MSTGKTVLISLIIVGLISACILSWQDYKMQQGNNKLSLVLDYQAVIDWSEKTGGNIEDLLTAAKEFGIQSIAVNELGLGVNANGRLSGFFEREPDVQAYTGLDILTLYNIAPMSSVWKRAIEEDAIARNNIYIYTNNEARGQELFSAAVTKYGNDRTIPISVAKGFAFGLEHRAVYPINGLGFDPVQLSFLRQQEFAIVPRFVNASYRQDENEQLDSYLKTILQETQAKTVIFAGREGVIGYQYGSVETGDHLDVTARNLRSESNPQAPVYGYVEMTKITGDVELARMLDYDMARVHSISSSEWMARYDKQTEDFSYLVNSAVQRYLLAANDRSVRIMYLRPFTRSVSANIEYFTTLHRTFADGGYSLSVDVSPVPAREILPQWSFLLLVLGFSAAIVLFIEVFVQLQDFWRYVFTLAGALALGGIVLINAQYLIAVQQLIALGSAVVFPVIAVFAILYNHKSTVFLKWPVVARVGAMFATSVLISLVGALYVHAALGIDRYMTAISVFPMVKVALFLPVLIALIAYFWRHEQGLHKIVSLLQANIRVFHLVLLGVLGLLGGYMLIRSGNFPVFGVSELELKLRLFLQQTLIARPRFKEFMVGYPILLVAGYLAARNRRDWEWVLLPGVMIGLTSLINTFAHLHKPLWMAVLTTFNGLWTGVVVGLILLIVVVVLERIFGYVMERVQ